MDSFYCPIPPCPSKRPVLQPSVPDVSLLMNVAPPNSYRDWKCSQNGSQRQVTVQQPSILKKQVRFDSPTISQNHYVQATPKPTQLQEFHSNSTALANNSNTPPMSKAVKNKQFNEIYMANIPNRHLDLSLVDVVKPVQNHKIQNKHDNSIVASEDSIIENVPPVKKIPTTYKEFLEMQKCEKETNEIKHKTVQSVDYITDIFNYTSPRTNRNEKYESNFREEIGCRKTMSTESGRLNGSHRSVPTGLEKVDMNESKNTCSRMKFTEKLTDYSNNTHKPSDIESAYMERSLVPNKRNIEELTSKELVEKDESTSKELVKNDEPTVKDLLKIIQQQNEQLLVLQKQVASLLNRREDLKQIEAPSCSENVMNDKYLTDQAQEALNSARSTPRKTALPKFSIDLMTSFEVSFRPQHNPYQRKQREPKIQEITEAESNSLEYDKTLEKRMSDTSLHLQEPIDVKETCPSPEPSIRIDMKDYESSDEENDNVTSTIGATFYKNLMDQVNKIIQSAQNQTNSDFKFSKNDEWKDRTMNKVRDATLKHLKKIGMNFSTIDEVASDYTNKSDDSTLEQISFAVKQLLMKYLPDEQLAKLANENIHNPKKHSQDKIVLNARAPEFSFATIQFMKKYNLIAGESQEPKRVTTPTRPIQNKAFKRVMENNPKILDISALRQQPKLL